MSTTEPDPIEELLIECLDRMDVEGLDAVEEICARNPEHGKSLRAELDKLRTLGLLAETPTRPADLGGFRLLREMRSGGEGVVYLAEQTALKRLVAVKKLPTASSGEAGTERMLGEARKLAALRHPNIVTVLQAGTVGEHSFLVMELVDGEDLDRVLLSVAESGELLPVRDILGWGRDLARALEAAHAAGIAHRDVKPSNVRINGIGNAILMDFGLARGLDDPTLTSAGSLRGTVRYMAPERMGTGHPDHRPGDVFSLGLTLYECLTGKPAFAGDTTEQILHEVLSPREALPEMDRKRIPDDLEVVLRKATEKDPRHRYATAAEFAEDLEALLEFRPIRAKPPGPVRRLNQWRRRHSAAAAALSVVAITAILLPVVLWSQERQFREQQRSEARQALDEARHWLDEYVSLRVETGPLQESVLARREELERRYIDPSEMRAFSADERQLENNLEELEKNYARGQEQAFTASRLDPSLREREPVVGELYLERARQASRSTDAREARLLRELARQADPGNVLGNAVDAEGRLTLNSDPTGAEVYLFRYRELSDLEDDGDPRLVPVPYKQTAGAGGIPVGSTVLRVVSAKAGLAPQDLILEIAGHPIAGTLLALTGNDEIQPLDRLLEIDGIPYTHPFPLALHASLDRQRTAQDRRADLHRFLFQRGPDTLTIEAPSLVEAGIEIVEPRVVAERGPALGLGIRASVLENGDLREIDLPPGLSLRPTAAPLILGRQSHAGTTPLSIQLGEGYYIALVHQPGHENQRLPFRIGEGQELGLNARMHRDGSSPAGFVFVPASLEDHGRRPFWIQEREVTFADYVAFLSDPETLEAIDAGGEPTLVPRGFPQLTRNGNSWQIADRHSALPLFGITVADARAYAEWRTERARGSGSPFRFRLPDPLEWELAASMPGGRAYAFGNHFRPKWLKSRLAQAQSFMEPPMQYPVDESPLGVFDLSGSVAEFNNELRSNGSQIGLRGGDLTGSRRDEFLYDADNFALVDTATSHIGFRLVATDR